MEKFCFILDSTQFLTLTFEHIKVLYFDSKEIPKKSWNWYLDNDESFFYLKRILKWALKSTSKQSKHLSHDFHVAKNRQNKNQNKQTIARGNKFTIYEI